MNKFKVIICIIILMLCTYAVVAYAENDITYDFEDGNIPNWTALYNNADMTIINEFDNHYLKLSYNGAYNRQRAYYDVKICDFYGVKDGILHVDYDVMYSNNDTEKDGDIQLKYRSGPGSSETQMVARVGKHNKYFRIHSTGGFSPVRNLSENVFEFQTERWYSIRIIVDFNKGMQSLYIFDKISKRILAHSEAQTTIEGNKGMNMITFSSGTDMYVDNIKIYVSDYGDEYISGSPYISKSTENKYYLFGKDSDGRFTAVPVGTKNWTLEKSLSGVYVESDTGRVVVESNPEPGYIVLKAELVTNSETIVKRYIVYVSN